MRPSSFLEFFFAGTAIISAVALTSASERAMSPESQAKTSSSAVASVATPTVVNNQATRLPPAQEKKLAKIEWSSTANEHDSNIPSKVASAAPLPTMMLHAVNQILQKQDSTVAEVSSAANSTTSPTPNSTLKNGSEGRGAPSLTDFRITTEDLPQAVVNRDYSVTLHAENGEQPFEWSAVELPQGIQVEPQKGKIFGATNKEGAYALEVHVRDATGLSAATTLDLIVTTTPLSISSGTLGEGKVGDSILVQLRAEGGAPPYAWESVSELPSGLTFDPASAQVSGVLETEGSFRLRFRVQDKFDGEDTAELPLEVAKAEQAPEVIEPTEIPSTSASPENTDATPPANSTEQTPEVKGSSNSSSSGGASLPLREPVEQFQARASNQKVGLAWVNSSDKKFLETIIVRGEDEYPKSVEDGKIIYSGKEDNCVDTDLKNGKTYFYVAVSRFADGSHSESAQASTTPQKVGLTAKANPFIDEVEDFSPLDQKNAFGFGRFPDIVFGPPRGSGEFAGSLDTLSLHARVNDDSGASPPYGGSITLRFSDNFVMNDEGPDFTVFENAFHIPGTTNFWIEPAVVDVSIDGVNYFRFPFDFVPHFDKDGKLNLGNTKVYKHGFAGVNPVYSNGTKPDPTDPERSGGDQFDLSDIKEKKLSWIQYVRITSTGDNWLVDKNGNHVRHTNEASSWGASGTGNSGFDLDAVAAIHY